MIDTIVLTLSHDHFHIIQPRLFKPSAQWALSDSWLSTHIFSRQNPTKQELLAGIYKPRLTLAPRLSPLRKLEPTLKIEFSVPKLMFGNNFQELRYGDFKVVVEKLRYALETMGIMTTIHNLEHADVTAVHYSKNIPLLDGSTPYHFIHKIKEANIKLSLDVNQTDYRNEGHSFKWHCNSYEVAFYDKIYDLQQAAISEKRAIEKDNALQLPLFDKLRTRKKYELLRMEARLSKRKKIRDLFNILGIRSALTFKKLFKPSISKKVLLHYLDELEAKRPLLLDYHYADDKALLAALIVNNPTLTPQRILQLYGLKKATEVVTLRELRMMLNMRTRTRSNWYRIMASAKDVALPVTDKPFAILREHVMKFKPVKAK